MASRLLAYIYFLVVAPWEISRYIFDINTYILPWNRQARQWSINQAVRVRTVRLALLLFSLLGHGDRLPLKPGRERERFVNIKPASDKLYKGSADDKTVRPKVLGATWMPSRLQPSEKIDKNTTVALHFHGGGYVIGDGRDGDAGFAAKVMVRSVGCSRVLSPQYRLSSHDGGRFPAPLQDAITSYIHLLRDLKVPASQIILSGDSAGGNMVIALLRYIDEYGEELDLPKPAAVALWSPWVDLGAAITLEIKSSPNYKTDYINGLFGRWGATTLSGQGMFNVSGPYLSPLHHPFKLGDMPVFVQTGDHEVLFEDDKLFVERFREEGNTMDLVISKGCPHDIILIGDKMGFAAEAREAGDRARAFFSKTTGLHLTKKTWRSTAR